MLSKITVVGFQAAFMSLLLAAQAGTPRTSAVAPKATVAYVSSQRISVESAQGKAGSARMRTLQQEKSAELRAKQQALEVTRQQLGQASHPTKRADLQRQEQQQRVELERATSQAQADIQSLQRRIGAELRPMVTAALDELLKGKNVEMVVDGDSSVIWAPSDRDLTSAVIERMNARAATPPR